MGFAVVSPAGFGGAFVFGAAFVFKSASAGASFVCAFVAATGEGAGATALLTTAGCAVVVVLRPTLTATGVATFAAFVAAFGAVVPFVVAVFAASPARAFGAG